MTFEQPTHSLYRFFNRDGSLLYVGRTVSPSTRWRTHERKAPWFGDVASMTREVFTTAAAVDAAERAAIATECPIHNIALNPNRRRPSPPDARPGVPSGHPETLITRWISIQPGAVEIEPTLECLGDETACECPSCHHARICAFEDQRSKYEWHPDLVAEIAAVEAKYYSGWDLTDWYYDLFDIEMFARGRLINESKSNPLPTYVEFQGPVALADCPFCFATHRHFLASGIALSEPVSAGCKRMGGGFYVLIDDHLDYLNELYQWGDESAKARRAA